MVEREELTKKKSLVDTFDFPHLIKAATECIDEMVLEVQEVKNMWQVSKSMYMYSVCVYGMCVHAVCCVSRVYRVQYVYSCMY